MTLVQAVQRLEEKGMWLRHYALEEDGPRCWVVCRNATWREIVHDDSLWEHVATGDTWQAAYAYAMGEAPY